MFQSQTVLVSNFRFPRLVSIPTYNGFNGTRWNFSRPNGELSRIRKVLEYLYRNPDSTLEDIRREVFNRPNRNGWGSTLFSVMMKEGFITRTRTGNRVTYRPSDKVPENVVRLK